jgi:uncharacterized FAD-dependent dehydrogenase
LQSSTFNSFKSYLWIDIGKVVAIEQIEFSVIPGQADDLLCIDNEISRLVPKGDTLNDWLIKKKSLDARSRTIIYRFKVEIYTNDDYLEKKSVRFNAVKKADKEAIIVGFGPAGMFAALQLLNRGIKPIIIERGKEVKQRRRDLAILNKEGVVNANSNYCFGEGGAGTFSDGKLYTRSNKRGDINQVLEWLVYHGAPAHILYEAHPHIGTNKLPAIVENIRKTIIEKGGEVHFNTQLKHLQIVDNKIVGIETNIGIINANHVILATGHSANDVFEMLHQQNITIYNKPFALGVRIEHPQSLIDSIQYKCEIRPKDLPASAYSLVKQIEGRGVFSFCMCPGGIIAPAATTAGEIVVNGWSPSKRNGKFANSGMVVSVLEEDWKEFAEKGPLAALYFQNDIERKAYIAAGASGLVAPAQRTLDFVKGTVSNTLPKCSYIPGVKSTDLFDVLPEAIASRIAKALPLFNNKMRGYMHPESILVAPESRTSSPVRIPRDRESLEHPNINGLYPCGEGAGYAGGIVSAAIDGILCAEKIFALSK